ncbi:MAG: hypothetical protein QF907_01600 [Nitrospinota bacterium]|jgi:hypothetical protein|nr:hypothetical protein [Nitrospinota bacterium]HJN02908.1 hypothetical protein [Nitrospinota bacterium]
MNVKVKSKISKRLYVIISLTLLSAILRLPSLDSPLDVDEGISFHDYAFSSWAKLFLEYKDGNQHTLFSALSRISVGFFGTNEIAYRLPVFLAGVFSIPLLYRVTFLFFSSEATAGLACYLLAFSTPHLGYSQNGRGYALSIFFSLALIFAVSKLLERKSVWLWGGLLTGFGFFLVLSVPSNIFFLMAAALFYFTVAWGIKGEKTKQFFDQKLIINSVPFLVMAGLVLGYIYVIYPGLRRNVEYYGQEMRLSNFLSIFTFLVSPWGLWLYLIFAFGLLNLKVEKKLLPFLCLFFTPLVLILISGFVGPPRVYIYLLPFVLMLVARGIVGFFSQINKRYGKKMEHILTAGFCICLAVQPTLSLIKYYPSRYHRKISTIDTAIQVRSYVAENVLSNTLIVIPYRDKTLLHYLEDRIIDNMIDILFTGKVSKIVFIGHQNIQPQEFPLRQLYQNQSMPLRKQYFELIEEIGNVKIYNFAVKISHFIPPVFDPDYEGKLTFQKSKDITIENIEDPKVIGRQALVIRNKTKKEFLLGSRQIKTVDIKSDYAYLLFAFFRGYPQGSGALLHSLENDWPPQFAYLNEHQKVHRFGKSDKYWQMVFLLSPLRKGKHSFQEVINLLAEENSHFDGFQSFILRKE